MKWYDNIMGTLRSWFNQPDGTESEIHAEMEKVGGLDGLKAKITSDVKAESQAEIDRLTAENTQLNSGLAETTRQFDALKTANETLTTDLANAQARISELEKRSTAKPTGVKSESGDGEDEEKMPVWKATQAYINSL